jgi:hypothetical protein
MIDDQKSIIRMLIDHQRRGFPLTMFRHDCGCDFVTVGIIFVIIIDVCDDYCYYFDDYYICNDDLN